MIKAVLIDLDGTLNAMDTDSYTKAYFSLISKSISGYNPQDLISGVMLGTKAMIKNDGEKTLENAFWQAFLGLLGGDKEQNILKFENFYKTSFKELKVFCGKKKSAPNFIKTLKDKGYKLVLASNPLFPQIAQRERASWTGANINLFDHITSYETSHFAKPNLNYYKEILDNFNLEPDECVMVGNDADDDLVIERLGVHCFLVNDVLVNNSDKDLSSVPQGSLDNAIEYIESLNK